MKHENKRKTCVLIKKQINFIDQFSRDIRIFRAHLGDNLRYDLQLNRSSQYTICLVNDGLFNFQTSNNMNKLFFLKPTNQLFTNKLYLKF